MVSFAYWSKLWQAFKDPSSRVLLIFGPLWLSFVFLCAKFFDDVLNDVIVEEGEVVIKDQENLCNCVCRF